MERPAIESGRFHLTGNPSLYWCIGKRGRQKPIPVTIIGEAVKEQAETNRMRLH